MPVMQEVLYTEREREREKERERERERERIIEYKIIIIVPR